MADSPRETKPLPEHFRPWEPGNDVAVTHGAYVSPVKLSGRAGEIADAIRPHLPVGSEAFEPTLQAYALVLTRIERADAALDEVEQQILASTDRAAAAYSRKISEELLTRLRVDLRAWLSQSLRFADALGLTPSSQARILRDAGVGKAAQSQAELAALREQYGGAR